MDLLKEMDGGECYFEENISEEVKQLLAVAAESYGEENAELLLLRAFLRAPESLTVLVALYRYYFYQHRLVDALEVADLALEASGKTLGLASDWKDLQGDLFDRQARENVAMGRFYLFALKGAGYMNMRMEKIDLGTEMLRKVRELDPDDRIGASVLLDVADFGRGLKVVN